MFFFFVNMETRSFCFCRIKILHTKQETNIETVFLELNHNRHVEITGRLDVFIDQNHCKSTQVRGKTETN